MSTTIPSLFISHGSPMMAAEPGPTGTMLRALGPALPRPAAIVVVSAHHGSREPEVGTGSQHETIYDFGGFPEALYRIKYPAHGSARVAAQVINALRNAGFAPTENPKRGLDHGAWVPLRYMYPDANVPVVPMSIQAGRDAKYHYALGQALAPLRAAGVLILATGNLTHNLYEIDPRARDGQAAPYAVAFQRWFFDRLVAGETETLLDWQRQAPSGERAHPTDEHLLPLFVALGAAGREAHVARLHDNITLGVLAMDAYAFGDDAACLAQLANATQSPATARA